MSSAMRLMFGLPAPETRDIAVDRDLEIPMPDGVVLLADRYYPRDLDRRPTILVRSSYTDRLKAGWQFELFAGQGFQVLVVSGRGVCGSGGELTPFVSERDDGAAVIDWIRGQEWFNGELGTTGASYLGYTQWAVAEYAGDTLKALSTQFISSDFSSITYPGGCFALELWMWWLSMVNVQDKSMLRNVYNSATVSRRNQKRALHLPLADLDRLVTGKTYPFWREWLEHEDPGDPWWERGDFSSTIAGVKAPNHLVGGWYDFMIPGLIRDYEALLAAGSRPYLTVGPWTHFDTKGIKTGTRESVAWLKTHLLGRKGLVRDKPVRIYFMGAEEWREYEAWPPVGVEPAEWYLQGGAGLTQGAPSGSEPDRFRFDPNDPTPSVGGAARSYGQGKPSVDNSGLEARPDVLTFTSGVLSADLEVIGRPRARLFVESSSPRADFFVRLCDVHPSGKSMNVCDGLTRAEILPDGIAEVQVELWPTAYRFKKGHRIRVQISGGCFPRWCRDLGTGEPLPTATKAVASEHGIYHDPGHPSSVTLPVPA